MATTGRRPWHLINTTIRTPFRLKSGLEALVAGGFEGDMGKERELEMAHTLDEARVISLEESTRDVTSISRKWRSALMKMGFIWATHPKSADLDSASLGQPYTLTPNGRRLLATRSLQAEQEVLLRAVSALRLPSPLERKYEFAPFSPLRHMIDIMLSLEEAKYEASISRLEMASIVILTDGTDDINDIILRTDHLRKARSKSPAKRRFDRETMNGVMKSNGYALGTYFDYQDVSFRYLKATGLFQAQGRGIALVPEHRLVARMLAKQELAILDEGSYLCSIANGDKLPTDDQLGATEVLNDLVDNAALRGLPIDLSRFDLTSSQGISLARHDIGQIILEDKEREYAARQPTEIDEILAYLRILDGNRDTVTLRDETLSIPRYERPAYFEWILWRTVLALNQLVIPPNKVRRFNIDQDFLPVSTASGGGADVIAEYDDTVLVIEVTLTENSRQEAAEGEPVRRHVAEVLEQFQPLGKAVYGLFIARRIDTNTAETFRIGIWYMKDDVRVRLNVVPLTISQLRRILEHADRENNLHPSVLIQLILDSSEERQLSSGAPEWKARIAKLIGT